MPYYLWKGVHISGSWRYGLRSAINTDMLSEQLYKADIGLTRSRCLYLHHRSSWKSVRIPYLRAAGELLESKIPLFQSLTIAAELTCHGYLKDSLIQCARDVERGTSIVEAFMRITIINDPLLLSACQVGQTSGQLSTTLTSLAKFYENKLTLSTLLTRAWSGPLLTLSAAFIIMLALIIGVIPSYMELSNITGTSLPSYIHTALAIRNIIISPWLPALVGTLIIFIYSSYKLARIYAPTHYDYLLLKIPLLGKTIGYISVNFYFAYLALLLEHGISITQALNMTSKTISNKHLNKTYTHIANLVTQGHTLADAWTTTSGTYLVPQGISLLYLGQTTGYMARAALQISSLYHQMLTTSIVAWAKRGNIALLILSGIVVGAMVIGLYLPILNLPDMASQFDTTMTTSV